MMRLRHCLLIFSHIHFSFVHKGLHCVILRLLGHARFGRQVLDIPLEDLDVVSWCEQQQQYQYHHQ